MQFGIVPLFVFFALMLSAPTAAGTNVQWQEVQAIDLDDEPLDILVVRRTGRVYILNDHGEIAVYSATGQLKGKIEVGADAVGIEAGPSADTVWLVRRKSKVVDAIRISVTEDIDIKGAPSKGAADAQVTVAVFSDFQ